MKLAPIGCLRSSIGWTTISLRPAKAACFAVAVTVPRTLLRVIRPPNRRCRRLRCPPGRTMGRAPGPPRDFRRGTPDHGGARRPYPPLPPEDPTAGGDGLWAGPPGIASPAGLR